MSKYIIIDNNVALSEIKLNNYYYCRVTDNPELKNIIIYNCQFSNGVTGDFYQIPETSVKKEADSIEELCDEFVLVKDNYKALLELETNRSTKSGFLKDIKTGWLSFIDDINDYLKRNYDLYGAIWTEWGLKYVAKMNKDGELELI